LILTNSNLEKDNNILQNHELSDFTITILPLKLDVSIEGIYQYRKDIKY